MSRRLLGIDIGSQYIKIAEVIRKGKGFFIRNPAVIRTPAFLVRNGRVSNDAGLVTLLKHTLMKYRYKTKKAVVILNDTLVITRDAEAPPAARKQTEKMLRLEASEYLPLDIKEYVFRFKILVPAEANSAKINYILVASARKDLIMDFYKVFKKAGVKPEAIDIPVNSMIKYFEKFRENQSLEFSKNKTTAYLDIGSSSMKLVVFAQGLPVYQQVISYNNARVDLMISSSLNITREEAEQHKINFGLSSLFENTEDETAAIVGQIIISHVNNMMNELYKYLQNYAKKYPSNPINEMVLAGGLSNMKGLDRYIEQSLSVPCTKAKMPEGFRVLESTEAATDIKGIDISDITLFTGILGAAIGGV